MKRKRNAFDLLKQTPPDHLSSESVYRLYGIVERGRPFRMKLLDALQRRPIFKENIGLNYIVRTGLKGE